jgi:hypothetical protein
MAEPTTERNAMAVVFIVTRMLPLDGLVLPAIYLVQIRDLTWFNTKDYRTNEGMNNRTKKRARCNDAGLYARCRPGRNE